jgi:ribose transport system ATP-binding protein
VESVSTEPGPAPSERGPEPVLQLENISKVFPGQIALDHVNLSMTAGRIHALLGQNGSGKSTLIKVLAGFHRAEAGSVVKIDGEPVTLDSAAASWSAGIRIVHQELDLIQELTVADNMALTSGYRSRWWVSSRREAARSQQVLQRFGVDCDVRRPVAEYPRVQQTLMAIARALRTDVPDKARVLVLDEPTAALPVAEARLALAAARRAADQGLAVLFVSHNIGEVVELADEVTVLRDGRVTAHRSAAGLDHDDIVELIVGTSLAANVSRTDVPPRSASGEPALRCEGVWGGAVEAFSMNVAAGEIVGLAGLLGSGRESVPYLLAGAQLRVGTVAVDGCAVPVNPLKVRDAGLIFVPGDRRRESTVPDMTLRENLSLRAPAQGAGGSLWLNLRRERRQALQWLQRMDVRPAAPERMITTLSGGNQQKVVLAAALRSDPKVLVLHEPTQGVDVGTRAAIYEELRDAAERGVAVVVSSSDSEELAELSQRVLVFRQGRVARELQGESETTAEAIDVATLGGGLSAGQN